MIDFKPNHGEALRYLGYTGGASADEKTLELLEKCEAKLLAAAAPRYIYRIFELQDSVLTDCKLTLSGQDITAHLAGCTFAALFCAGLGEGADRLLRTAQLEDMAEAVVLDALASSAVETLCNSAEQEIYTKFAAEHKNCSHTTRFSPGYGDLPLELQKDFLRVLDAGKGMGLFVNESCCLVPTKSVTAIIGFSSANSSAGSTLPAKSCDICRLRENCSYRKAGKICGV